jgi:pilus assembly protein Flp/PilA
LNKLMQRLRDRTRRDEGASAVEYGLLVALIAVAIAATIGFLGGALRTQLRNSCVEVADGGAANCGAP